MNEDVIRKYWKEYQMKNAIDKRKHVINIVDEIMDVEEIKDVKIKIHVIGTLLSSYFDDLIKELKRE